MATSSALATSNQYVKYTISITQGSQSVAGNYSNVTVSVRFYRTNSGYSTYGTGTVYCKINGTTYSAGVFSSQKITNAGIVLFSKNLNIPHNADGTKYLTCSAWISHNAPLSSSEQAYGQWLTTIPRATTPALDPAEVTMGESIAISLPRASSSFTHTLQYDFQKGEWTTFATGADTSGTLEVPTEWVALVTDSDRATGKIRCLTYNGSTLIGEKTVNFTAIVPDNIVPSVNSITVTEATVGIAVKFGAFIQHKSTLRVVSAGSGAQGSAIASCKVEVQGITYTGTDITTYAVTVFGKVDVKATVTDSRGRTASKTVQVTVIEYYTPTIRSFDAFRAGADGMEQNGSKTLKCVYSFNIAPCGDKNSKSYKIEYKRDRDTSWTTLTSGALYSMNTSYMKDDVLSLEYGYNIRLTVSDYFTSATYELSVGTEIVPLCVYPSGKGLGIGSYPTKEALQVFFDTELHSRVLKFMGAEEDGADLDVLTELKALRAAVTELNGKLGKTIKIVNNRKTALSHNQAYGLTQVQCIEKRCDTTKGALAHSGGQLIAKRHMLLLVVSNIQISSSGIYMTTMVNGGYTVLFQMWATGIGNYSAQSIDIIEVHTDDTIAVSIGKSTPFLLSANDIYATLSAYILCEL